MRFIELPAIGQLTGDDFRVAVSSYWQAIMNPESEALMRSLEVYRGQITAHCYRMLGSLQDAEEVAQDTLLRGWQKRVDLGDDSARRAWLFTVATRRCLDALRKKRRRRAAGAADVQDWVEPAPDTIFGLDVGAAQTPEEAIARKERISLAFVMALQWLSPKQRAALLLMDVLGWSVDDAARLLKTTNASINSLLQRARKFLSEHERNASSTPMDDGSAPVAAFVSAWERGDVEGLAALLAEDAWLTMPPEPGTFFGRDAVTQFLAPHVRAAPRNAKFITVSANGSPAVAVYKLSADGSHYLAVGISVLTGRNRRISSITRFGFSALFPRFGLRAAIDVAP